MRTIDELEQQLQDDPFDLDLRYELAAALAGAEQWSAAEKQWRLLLRQNAAASNIHLGLARVLLEQGQREEAVESYRKARELPDFEPSPELEAKLGLARQPAFTVVDGGASAITDEVVPLRSESKVRFADIVGMRDLKKTIKLRIVEPFKKPGLFARFRKKTGGGILLYGPPGCGKTMIAKAIATECGASFTSVGISDVLNLYIGESERQLAAVFERARAETPAVLFFDELDALAYARSKAASEHTRKLVNEFLAQLDGMGANNEAVLVLAATNMPWDVDSAMKRPGRFDRQIFVPPPDTEARAEMFKTKLVGVPVEGLDPGPLAALARRCSGADIDGIIERAKESTLEDIIESGEERPIQQRDLLAAAEDADPTTLEWLKTARNLVKFGGGGAGYKEVEKYLRHEGLY